MTTLRHVATLWTVVTALISVVVYIITGTPRILVPAVAAGIVAAAAHIALLVANIGRRQ